MSAATQFQKALLLLDRGDADRAEALFKDAISGARDERDIVTEIQASCALGDLLCEQGRRGVALPLLERVATMQLPDDVLAYEVERAKWLLATGSREAD